MNDKINILSIESSCDDTAAAVISDGFVLSNVIANQEIHKQYGGVIPEAASRAHQANIIPVVHQALMKAKIAKENITAVAYTRGPGLLGSLLVGSSFAKAFALAMNIPLIEINHMQAHILSHYILEDEKVPPAFPFLCLTVSGGHTQIVLVKDYFVMEIIGETTDDAAGEAFDKIAKTLGLPYPGGPFVDKFAKLGNATRFQFTHPNVPNYDYSFSGLKTAVLYLVRDGIKADSDFIATHLNDICASAQKTIVDILIKKLKKAAKDLNINEIALAGGVSANSGLRNAMLQLGADNGWRVHIPKFEYCTDNAAMIGIAGYIKYLKNDFSTQDVAAKARLSF
ncbi:MAG: tRNA (adenosine(37)-N6)-threonylcarbamoyltransferase complex transferase subunit TsaD [Bacteroidota bacterium]